MKDQDLGLGSTMKSGIWNSLSGHMAHERMDIWCLGCKSRDFRCCITDLVLHVGLMRQHLEDTSIESST